MGGGFFGFPAYLNLHADRISVCQGRPTPYMCKVEELVGGAGFLAGPLAYITKSKFRLFIAFLVRNPKIFGKFS